MLLLYFKILNLFYPRARANRKEYIIGMILDTFLFTLLFVSVSAMSHISEKHDVAQVIMPLGVLLLIGGFLVLMVRSLFLGIRRLHDLNYPGYYSLLLLVPMVNILLFLTMLFKKGTIGENDYGLEFQKSSSESNTEQADTQDTDRSGVIDN